MDQQEVALLAQAAGLGVVVDAEVVRRDDLARTQAGARTFWTKVRKNVRPRAPSTLSAASAPACAKAPSASIDAVAYHAR